MAVCMEVNDDPVYVPEEDVIVRALSSELYGYGIIHQGSQDLVTLFSSVTGTVFDK